MLHYVLETFHMLLEGSNVSPTALFHVSMGHLDHYRAINKWGTEIIADLEVRAVSKRRVSGCESYKKSRS